MVLGGGYHGRRGPADSLPGHIASLKTFVVRRFAPMERSQAGSVRESTQSTWRVLDSCIFRTIIVRFIRPIRVGKWLPIRCWSGTRKQGVFVRALLRQTCVSRRILAVQLCHVSVRSIFRNILSVSGMCAWLSGSVLDITHPVLSTFFIRVPPPPPGFVRSAAEDEACPGVAKPPRGAGRSRARFRATDYARASLDADAIHRL